MAVVETRGLRKHFGDTRAVDGIDLTTEEGEYLVLLGPSGCGKTTLLRLIAGLEQPTEGDVLIGGRVVTGLPPRVRKIAMVFQSYALYPHKTVYKNIVFPLGAQGVPKEQWHAKVTWAATVLGIGQLKLHLLSPGGHVVWLGNDHLAMGSIIALQTWRILPLATLIVMAGMSSISQDIRDATEVDGARFWRRTLHIDLPLLAPVILVALLFGIVFSFADMAVVFILTGGAPANSTQVLASWAFYKGINGGNLAVGAADAVLMFPVLLGLAAIVLRFARRAEVG